MDGDKVTESLVAALKQAVAGGGEQRLYKSGKLSGLFASRAGAPGEAAAQAVRDGLLEVVRTETRGKAAVEWVRPTLRGVTFLHERESPLKALQELRAALQATREGVPAWMAAARQDLQALSDRLTAESERWLQRLDALGHWVEEALRRLEAAGPQLPAGATDVVPWALEALTYLDQRRQRGAGDCPLPELFATVAEKHPGLSLVAFHDGLRRLHDRGAVRLVPFTAPPSELPQPEFALLDGATVFYHAAR
jgi:hypothetical protein